MIFLLITKNYPPQLGGLEKYSYDLRNTLLKQGHDVFIIYASPRKSDLLTKSRVSFFWSFLYYVSELFRLSMFGFKCITMGLFYSRKADIIWSLDASISPIALFLGFLFQKKTRVTIHGTDIVFCNPIYQLVIPKIVGRIDEIFTISSNTYAEIVKRNISPRKIVISPHSIETSSFIDPGIFNKDEFLLSIGVVKTSKKILFSVGRWIERKGFHWFLESVLPNLKNDFIYILAGFGPYKSIYLSIISQKGLANVIILDNIDNLTKSKLFSISDFFIMPNIVVENDCEGFGIVLLEARYYGLKILLSDADGIANIAQKGDVVLKSGDNLKWIDYLNNI